MTDAVKIVPTDPSRQTLSYMHDAYWAAREAGKSGIDQMNAAYLAIETASDYVAVRREDLQRALALCEFCESQAPHVQVMPRPDFGEFITRLRAGLSAAAGEPLATDGKREWLVSALVSRPLNGSQTTYGHRAARVLAKTDGEAIGWATPQWVVDGFRLESICAEDITRITSPAAARFPSRDEFVEAMRCYLRPVHGREFQATMDGEAYDALINLLRTGENGRVGNLSMSNAELLEQALSQPQVELPFLMSAAPVQQDDHVPDSA